MGQKINPLAFRIATSKNFKSEWFACYQDYKRYIVEDAGIRSVFNKLGSGPGISKVGISRNGNGDKIKIDILCARPGVLVGPGGTNLSKCYNEINKNIKNKSVSVSINVIPLKEPDAEAVLIADFIVEQLEKRVAYRRAMRKAIERTQLANVAGIKIEISGRLNGAEIARREWAREGRVPLQTLRADIDYASTTAHTIYGSLGVKVWLFHEVKLNIS